MFLYPLKFKPIYKQRIWGGWKLHQFFAKEIARDKKIGESWELADLPDDKSVIANGELVGQTITAAIAKYPQQIIGDQNFSAPFPLLIKFLDAQDKLSVQVHPDAKTCRRMGTGRPKTECWYIIAADNGATIYKGLKQGVTKAELADAVRAGTVADMLVEVCVSPGECHFLPAGTAHSIGPGLLIAEIQTPSDTTYRLFDFNRVDDSGKPRPLHIEQALKSIHFDSAGDNLSVTTSGRLVDCEFFKIDKARQADGGEATLSAGKMKCLIFLSGSGVIAAPESITVEFKAGETILIPAVYQGTIHFSDDTDYLTVTI